MKILKFEATWCAPCKMIAPIIKELTDDTDIQIQSINIDSDGAMAAQFNVRSVPTLILLNDDGTEKTRQVGNTSRKELERFISYGRS